MSQLLRVQNFCVSVDGFGAGEGQSLERPFGHANPADLASWAFATASWPNRTEPGGSPCGDFDGIAARLRCPRAVRA